MFELSFSSFCGSVKRIDLALRQVLTVLTVDIQLFLNLVISTKSVDPIFLH